MQLTKWDGAPDSTKTTLIGGGSSSSSSNENVGTRDGGDLDRTIWGQHDRGDDIDGSATIHGDVHIKAITPPQYDPDDDDEEGGEYEEEEEGGGSLDVEVDVTVGRHLYINDPHPAHSGEKKCVGELINGLDGRLTTAEGNISSLSTKVNTNTTNITNLTSRMDDAEDDIQTNADDIANLKASNLTTDDVLKLIRDNQPSKLGAYDQPVVLFSGRARRVTYYSDKYYIEGVKLPHFSLSNVIEDGLMTITITPDTGYTINVYGVHCNQERSGDTTDEIVSYHKGRSDGAHWFECRVNAISGTTKVYLKEFHQGNGDNDTWYSDSWFGDGGIKAVHFTLIGYITPPST